MYAQSNTENNSFWIYTYSSEMKDYQINAIEGNELVINNGSWDVKLPITDIERIALSPGPSGRGQFLGAAISGGNKIDHFGCLCLPKVYYFKNTFLITPSIWTQMVEKLNNLRE